MCVCVCVCVCYIYIYIYIYIYTHTKFPLQVSHVVSNGVLQINLVFISYIAMHSTTLGIAFLIKSQKKSLLGVFSQSLLYFYSFTNCLTIVCSPVIFSLYSVRREKLVSKPTPTRKNNYPLIYVLRRCSA